VKRRPLKRWQSAATAEEEAELRMLRARAEATGREVGDTAAALASRLAEDASPRMLVRRTAARAKARAWHAVRGTQGQRAGRLRLAAAAGVTTGLVLVTVAVIWQHRRPR
jgi:hypothetical protein